LQRFDDKKPVSALGAWTAKGNCFRQAIVLARTKSGLSGDAKTLEKIESGVERVFRLMRGDRVMVLRKRFLAKFSFILTAVFWLSMPQAWAQDTIHGTLSGSQSTTSNYTGGSYRQYSLRANFPATVTGVVIQLGSNTTADATTIENNGRFRLDGRVLNFVSYDASNFTVTFTTNRTFTQNEFLTLDVGCSTCGSSIIATSDTSTSGDWSFSAAPHPRVRLTGTIPNNAPVLSSIGAQSHRENDSIVSVTTGATDSDSGDTLT
jgi:hypothetical protein